MRGLLWVLFVCLTFNTLKSQSCDCPYPIIFLHGFTGNHTSYSGTYSDADFISVWGGQTDIFHAVMNAQESTNIWGDDGTPFTSDDDVLLSFNNESNVLIPGCVYSINFENYWNEDEANPMINTNVCGSPTASSSNSNESAIYKAGFALGRMIESVLTANPGKDKVILVGHSMGGLKIREYLQRESGQWWAGNTPGHGVKKAVSTVTPHLGSNFFGNPWPLKPKDEHLMRNGWPDIWSEATRDLRYSYSVNIVDPTCGLFTSCPGPYLFGGTEDYPWGYWNEDVNCDGDDDQGDVIIGINNSGGTADNAAMPLPLDVRYTWVTSNLSGTGSDGVVDIDRQWLYTGNVPSPSDGVSHRLTDTLLTNTDHLGVDDETNTVVQALDESDYPLWAWDLNLSNLNNYAALAQVRSVAAPEGPHTDDPDWFRVFIPNGTTQNLCISFDPNENIDSQIDYFSNPGDYTTMSTVGDYSLTIASGTTTVNLIVPNADLNLGDHNYFRIIHKGVDKNSWRNPYKINTALKFPVPIELISFQGKLENNQIRLDWSTAQERNNEKFEIYKSQNGMDFEFIGSVEGAGNSDSRLDYSFYDLDPQIGPNYYKLKQVDFDGSFAWTQIIQVNYNSDNRDLKVYPNPAKNTLFVKFDENISKEQIQIFDVQGKYWKTKIVESGDTVKELDLNNLPSGVYTLQVIHGDQPIKKLFVKN